MANKMGSTYEFKITSDASQFLTELKKVRDAAESAGLDKKILGNIDKEFANAQKLLTNYQTSLQNNKSVKGIETSQKALEKLNFSYAKLGVLIQQASKAENFKPDLTKINQLQQIQQSLLSQQNQLKLKAEDYLDSKRKDFRLTQDETKELKKQLTNYEQLKNVASQILQSRQTKLTSTAAKIGIKTDFGQTALSNQQTAIENSVLTSGLFTPANRKKANKNKMDLRTNDKEGLVNTAAVTIAKEYAGVLEKIAIQELSVDQGIETFIKSLAEYGVAVSDVNALQAQFQESLESIAQETINNKGSLNPSDKGKITKAQNEVVSAQNLTTTGINSSEIQGLINNLQQVEQTEEQINQALVNQQLAAQQAAQTTAQGAIIAQNNNEKIIQQENEELNLKRQDIQAQDELNQTFERMSSAVKQVLSLTSAWRMLRQVVSQTFNDVKNLDKSFAEIAMVTSYSVKDMWSSYSDYAQMANDLGQSTESVIKASGLFYQQGLNTAESLELTEETMKLATLAGLDFSEATSQMTAALRGFHMEMDQGSHITDVYSELAAKAAADVNGIAYAMSKTSSIASSAGMSFENTAAFLTTMIEATQEAPSIRNLIY